MAPMLIPSSTQLPADRNKRKASSSLLQSEASSGVTDIKTAPSRTEKLAKLLKVEELASSRRRRRRSNEDPQVLDLAAIKIWRQLVVQWFFDVVDHFDLPRDVVHISAEILDSYIATANASVISNSHYQEVSIAAIFLATRMVKPKTSRISMESFLMQTMGKKCNMTSSQAMEVVREVSSALDWTYPILPPSAFVKQLLGIIPKGRASSASRRRTTEALEHVLYLTELAVVGDLSSSFHASDIALAAMIQTMNPKTGPVDCCLTQQGFDLMTQELKKEMNLDFSNDTIQGLCTKLGEIYTQSLASFSNEEPRPTNSSRPAPVLIEEEEEEPQETENNDNFEEYNRFMDHFVTQSPTKRLRIN